MTNKIIIDRYLLDRLLDYSRRCQVTDDKEVDAADLEQVDKLLDEPPRELEVIEWFDSAEKLPKKGIVVCGLLRRGEGNFVAHVYLAEDRDHQWRYDLGDDPAAPVIKWAECLKGPSC